MHNGSARSIHDNPPVAAALVIAVVGAGAILGALFFQYGYGLKPCPLCLDQRIPYYVAIPLAVLVAIAAWRDMPRAVVTAGLGLLALTMLVGVGLGIYHAGIEWKWWVGPRDCSGALDSLGGVKDLLQDLETMSPVRCDQAAWRFLGISLAGYNAVIALALAGVAAWGMSAPAGSMTPDTPLRPVRSR